MNSRHLQIHKANAGYMSANSTPDTGLSKRGAVKSLQDAVRAYEQRRRNMAKSINQITFNKHSHGL